MVPLERGIDSTDLPSPTAEGITLCQILVFKPLEAFRVKGEGGLQFTIPHFQFQFLKLKGWFPLEWWWYPPPIKLQNPRTYEKVHCKGDQYIGSQGQRDPSVQTKDRQTSCFLYRQGYKKVTNKEFISSFPNITVKTKNLHFYIKIIFFCFNQIFCFRDVRGQKGE